MGALDLEMMTWPQVKAELAAGRDTVVVPFGAVEQHGPHLPLGTDAFFGDEIGRAVAARLEAFLAPTVRVGCSRHHMAFAGTLTLEDDTFTASSATSSAPWLPTASGASSSCRPTGATSGPSARPSPGWGLSRAPGW